jgi:hypothetical protein
MPAVGFSAVAHAQRQLPEGWARSGPEVNERSGMAAGSRNRLCFSRFRDRSPVVPGAMLDDVIPAVWIGLGPLSPNRSSQARNGCVKSLMHCEKSMWPISWT